jgi:hypothetical protein
LNLVEKLPSAGAKTRAVFAKGAVVWSHSQSLLYPNSGTETILTWPSGLCELSFSNCDNRKRATREPMEEKRPLRRQPEDHNFGSLLTLAVTAGAFLLVTWVARRRAFSSSKSLQSLENRLAKACPCFERLSRIGDVRRCGDGLGGDRASIPPRSSSQPFQMGL